LPVTPRASRLNHDREQFWGYLARTVHDHETTPEKQVAHEGCIGPRPPVLVPFWKPPNAIAFVDFSTLKNRAITVNADRTSVTVTLPKPQLEPALLNVSQSYVYAQQQGLFNRIGNFFSGNPNSPQAVYQIAQQRIQTAARQSPLLTEAQKNTESMLTGMLTSLGFQHVTVTFGPSAS
jgi:Protein of unknown function (DUF4230)